MLSDCALKAMGSSSLDGFEERAEAAMMAGGRASRPAAAAVRTAVLTSSDPGFRRRVRDALTSLRWEVREATGGAEALAHLDEAPAETMILDAWLPDLEIQEFITEFEKLHPEVDLVTVDDAGARRGGMRSPRRNEVLLALRRGQDGDGAAWNGAPVIERRQLAAPGSALTPYIQPPPAYLQSLPAPPELEKPANCRLPELIGEHQAMIEVSRRVRLVAPHKSAVLIEGPTGSGKELVARAVHRLSARAERPFVALNCAAVPEALLEAELFGHTRGAFTGALQGRIGRLQAANGGTLFLDEIGEMPLAMQAKLLRFVEGGELQRVGENEAVKVDVRVVAATHRSLKQLSDEGAFRADLYYRLAVFLIHMPALAAHIEDLPRLAAHVLAQLAQTGPEKSLDPAAMERLSHHRWLGNVRELEHVLERAWILAEARPSISAAEIEFGEQESALEIEEHFRPPANPVAC
jgi:DNA-binding NtrC family response regulator